MKNPNRKWKNKQSGKEVKVRPYWELPDPDIYLTRMIREGTGEKTARVGVLYQAGWLIYNNDIYFVLPLNAEEHFEDLGEWKDDTTKSDK